MRLLATLIFTCLSTASLFSQTSQYETIVAASDQWKYLPGTSDPGSNWFSREFNDATWAEGPGGIGYGDGDDGTVIAQVRSVFLRKTFSVSDVSSIEALFLHVDYDDGFIAYLNGVEIGRRNMGSGSVPYNAFSTGLREATMYTGGLPELIATIHNVEAFLVNGENVLAVQVHNENDGSSDLSSLVFLSAKTRGETLHFRPAQPWFRVVGDEGFNLPLVVLETNGKIIQDEVKIVIEMGIIDNGPDNPNHPNDPYNIYDGKVSIELRGESSQMFPKKSYTIETQDDQGNNRNVPLLGMPAENDWVLYAPYTDKTMMRNVLAYKMGNDLGNYAPRTRYVELFLNGEYHGVYVLVERIKIDKNRVNLATLKPEDVSGDEVTGGYIMRVDKTDWNDYPAFSITPSPKIVGENVVTHQYFDPKGDELQAAQRQYISNFLFRFESALSSPDFRETSDYKKFIDLDAFIDHMIVTEIGKNVDGYVFSTYMHKDKDSKGGKLKMGPLWDFNLAFGNVDYWANSQFAPGWMYEDSYRMYWFRRMMSDPSFSNRFKCRWKSLRSSMLTDRYFTTTIDSIAALLDAPQQRNFTQWPILGVYIWPNQYVGQTYQDEIAFLKTWITNRLRWMDNNLWISNCELITSNEEELSSSLSVYPNPANGTFRIVSKRMGHGLLTVTDVRGLNVITIPFIGEASSENLGDLNPGLYVLKVSYPDGRVDTAKIVITR